MGRDSFYPLFAEVNQPACSPANLVHSPRCERRQAALRASHDLPARPPRRSGATDRGIGFGISTILAVRYDPCMIAASYKPKKKFMQLAIAEAKRARDRGDYPIGAVITRVTDGREVVIASAGNRVKTSGSSIKHVELETLKYVSSGYGRYLTEFVLYTTHEPCAMCAGACVWARIGAVVYGVSQEDIAAYGGKRGTEEYKWRACLIPCRLVFEKGNHPIPVIGAFLRDECKKLFGYGALPRRVPNDPT